MAALAIIFAASDRVASSVPTEQIPNLHVRALHVKSAPAPMKFDRPVHASAPPGLKPPPLCQDSCRLNRFGTFGGADSSKWLDTDKRIRIG
jgi:hypothetical protein